MFGLIYSDARPYLWLKTRPSLSPFSLSLSMTALFLFKKNVFSNLQFYITSRCKQRLVLYEIFTDRVTHLLLCAVTAMRPMVQHVSITKATG